MRELWVIEYDFEGGVRLIGTAGVPTLLDSEAAVERYLEWCSGPGESNYRPKRVALVPMTGELVEAAKYVRSLDLSDTLGCCDEVYLLCDAILGVGDGG